MTSHSSHTLTFSQLVGTFTVDKELLGAQDPYVIFEAGGHKCQTKAIKSVGAGTCEWKETYELKEFSAKSAVKEVVSKTSGHSHNSTTLEVTAYNHNTLRPDGVIGSGTIDLARLGSSQLSGRGDRVAVHLTDKKGKSVGELKFLIHGGGYQGAGSSNTTGYGITSGYGTTTSSSDRYTQNQSLNESHIHSEGRPITGVGSGPTYDVAHQAAQTAARQGHEVDLQTRQGVAHGAPTGAGYGSTEHSHSHSGSGVQVQGVTSGVKGVDVAPGEVIDRKYYVATEDRPQEQALVEQFREHNPYAKEYETTVQHTGRERQVGSSIEALGTAEKVVETRNIVHQQPHELIARALPEGAIAQRPGGEGWVQGKPGPVCDSTRFEVTGDITVDKERVTNLREHREYEKEFEVKTALVAERALAEAARVEQLNRERILLDEKKKIACAEHPTVEAPTTGLGHTSGVTSGSHATTHTHGTGLTSGTHTTGARDSTSSYGSAGQEKGMFQKVKEAVLPGQQHQGGSNY